MVRNGQTHFVAVSGDDAWTLTIDMYRTGYLLGFANVSLLVSARLSID